MLATADARQQRITFQLQIIIKGKQRILLIERDEIALLAKDQQPVIAQPVGNGATVVASQVLANFRRRRLYQTRLQTVVIDVGRNGIIGQTVGQLGGLAGIITAGGVAQRHEDIVIIDETGHATFCLCDRHDDDA